MKNVFATILFLFVTVSAWSEINPVFHHYTTEDGLFHNEIRQIRKAKNGMLWLGTQNGLSSFDGYRFIIYKHNENNANSICSDKIYALATSVNGTIWVGTTTGLCILNPATGKSVCFADTFSIKTNFKHDYIYNLLEDRSGYLWICAASGNFRYSIHTKTLEKVLEGIQVKSFYESPEGTFWVCHNKEVSRYNRNSKNSIQTYPFNINKLYTDRFGVLWGVGEAGLFRFLPGEKKFEFIKKVKHPLHQGFNSIAEDKHGNLFLGNYAGGITIYCPKTNTAQYLRANPNNSNSLSSNDIYDIFADDAGVVWIGTQEGLDYYDWSRQRFIKWKHSPDNPNGLSNSFIQYIYRDNNNQLWLGTRDNGMEKLNNSSSVYHPEFEHFPPQPNSAGIKGNYIGGMFHDLKGRFWVASWASGLSLKENNNENWKHFFHHPENSNSIPGNSVTSLTEDRKGRILAGTLSGLSIITQDKNGGYDFDNFQNEKGNKNSPSGNAIFTVKEDSKGRIWLGINNAGLNLMHEEIDGEIWFEHFIHNPEDSTSISNNEVFVVFEDSKKQLWAGTSFAGFNRVIEKTESNGKSSFSFKAYTEKEGLPDNEVNGILEDEFGNLWISTNKGLSCFNPENETFENYTEYDGVLKGKFRKNAAWKDEDGTMFFGGAAGVNVFNSTHFPKNKITPQPAITGIFINRKQYFLGDSIGKTEVVKKNETGEICLNLPSNANSLVLNVSAMSYTSPKRNKYEWQLEGFDVLWNNYEGNSPEISYNGLQAGKYTLLIRASNNDGVWNNSPLKVNIKIKHEFDFGSSAAVVVFIVLIGFVVVFSKKKKDSNLKKTTTFSEVENELANRLDDLMKTEQLYLDFKLGLTDLADKLGTSSNHLSALLNDVIGKSFYDYVNEFRIKEVKKRLISPEHKNKTILSIAWECGFNSKSAFNRVFKASTGLTPSLYQKKYSE